MPTLPGPVSQWVDRLRRLLQTLEQTPRPPETPGGKPDTQSALSGLTRAGVLEKSGPHHLPTPAGRLWRDNGDHAVLVAIFHTHVRFVGELMDALDCRPATHRELLELANSRYGLCWDTPTPVRDRTNWLRALGLADLFDGRVHLTETGRQAHELLVPGSPDPDEEQGPVDLPSPPPTIATLIRSLDRPSLEGRTRSSTLYVPGHRRDIGRREALRILTEAATPSVTDDAFTRLVLDRFPGARTAASARAARDTAKALGLIRRVSSTAWTATPAARAWLTTDQPVDLARIIHAHVAYFGEILHDLDLQAPPTAAGLAEHGGPRTTGAGRRMSALAIKARLDLLLACGLITKMSQTTYRPTTLGRAFRDTVPCLHPSSDDTATSTSKPTATTASPTDSQSLAQAIATELEAAARDSPTPRRLEIAAIEALTYLGMPGTHIGGNGNTDGQVHVGVGVHRRVLAVETKSSATGRVIEQSLLGLPIHREKIGADVTLFIGPGFEQRLQKAVDDDPAIAAIFTETLAEAVRAQALTPLTPTQLHPLIDPTLSADQRLEPLQQAWNTQLRRAHLERTLVDILNVEAEDPLQEGGWLDAAILRRELRSRGQRADHSEVVETLAFLASPRIAVVEQSDNHGYRAVATAETALQRMNGLGQQWKHEVGTPGTA